MSENDDIGKMIYVQFEWNSKTIGIGLQKLKWYKNIRKIKFKNILNQKKSILLDSDPYLALHLVSDWVWNLFLKFL